jgi:hypothetical protein
MNEGYTKTTPGMRGTKLVQQYPRDNDDGITDESLSRYGRELGGGNDDISPMIKNGKVPSE